jgi:hypothetical protein
MNTFVQIGIAVFGLSALWMALGNSLAQRRWAPVLGLVGQMFWLAFAWESQSFGIALLVPAYTAVYLRGLWVQRVGVREVGNG